MEISRELCFDGPEEWREWLLENHSEAKECWVRLSKENGLNYQDSVYQALCFGWIDSTAKVVDGRRIQRFSPRRKRSNWTELNKERARYMIRLGLMTEAGYETLPDLNEEFTIPDEVLDLMKEDDGLYQNFMGLPDLYVRIRLSNILGYKQSENEFQRKLDRFMDHTRRNELYGEWNDNGRLLDNDEK